MTLIKSCLNKQKKNVARLRVPEAMENTMKHSKAQADFNLPH